MIDKYTVSSVKIFYKKLTFQFHIENRVCLIDIGKCFMLYDFEKRAVFIENNFLLRSTVKSLEGYCTNGYLIYYFVMHSNELIKKEIKVEVMAFIFIYIISSCFEFQQRPFECLV